MYHVVEDDGDGQSRKYVSTLPPKWENFETDTLQLYNETWWNYVRLKGGFVRLDLGSACDLFA